MTLEQMQKKLDNLESILEIQKLHTEYMFWVNNRQWDEVVNCFSEDASVLLPRHGRFTGKSGISNLYKERVEKSNLGQGRDAHFVLQPAISVDGDQANGHWLMYIIISDPETGKPSRLIRGRHDAEYTRVEGQWKIKSLKYTRPWPEEPETPDKTSK